MWFNKNGCDRALLKKNSGVIFKSALYNLTSSIFLREVVVVEIETSKSGNPACFYKASIVLWDTSSVSISNFAYIHAVPVNSK